MFITTIRVRRARRARLDAVLTAKQLQDYRDATLVEVMAHGQTVAVVDVGHVAKDGSTGILWRHDAVKDDPQAIAQAVYGALVLMEAAHEGGLTATPEAPERAAVPAR